MTSRNETNDEVKDPQIFQTPRSHLNILNTRGMTYRKFHEEGPQILGATIHNLVNRRPGARDLCSLALKQNYTEIRWNILRTLRCTYSVHVTFPVAYEMT